MVLKSKYTHLTCNMLRIYMYSPQPPSLTLSQLTLQEALRVQRPEFIQHSLQRVQRVSGSSDFTAS